MRFTMDKTIKLGILEASKAKAFLNFAVENFIVFDKTGRKKKTIIFHYLRKPYMMMLVECKSTC